LIGEQIADDLQIRFGCPWKTDGKASLQQKAQNCELAA